MAAAGAACVSTTCCSITRDGYSVTSGGATSSSLPRIAFCGEKLTATSLKAQVQAWLPAPSRRKNSAAHGVALRVSSVLNFVSPLPIPSSFLVFAPLVVSSGHFGAEDCTEIGGDLSLLMKKQQPIVE